MPGHHLPQSPPRGELPGTNSPDPPAPRRHFNRAGTVLGGVLLCCWASMWLDGYLENRLDKGEDFWVPEMHVLGGDFIFHIARTARIWAEGGNPYEPEVSWLAFPYPPLVPRLFTWTSLMGIREAVAVWLVGIASLTIAATMRTRRTRRELGIQPVPLTLLLSAVLFSTPVLFAMERGQCDVLVLPLLAGGVAAMRGGTKRLDLLAGLLFVVSAYVKYYPGLVLVGLLALRRWHAVGGFVGAGAIIGLIDLRWLLGSFENMKAGVAMAEAMRSDAIHPCDHSLSGCWRSFWTYWDLTDLAELPGPPMAAAIILPLVGLVCLRVARSGGDARLLWPLMLWVVAAATFVPPMASDYNLFFLPLAALAVWDRRDPAAVHLLMAYLLLWWQPFDLEIDGALVLAFKLGGLVAVGLSLCRRASELASEIPEAARERRGLRPGLIPIDGVR